MATWCLAGCWSHRRCVPVGLLALSLLLLVAAVVLGSCCESGHVALGHGDREG